MNGKAVVLGLASVGIVGLLLRSASKATSEPIPIKPKAQTYVDKQISRVKPGITKGKAEVTSVVNAINDLIK